MWCVAEIFLCIISLVTVVECQGGGGGGGGGGFYGVGAVIFVLICLPIYCCCAGRPRRSNAKFVKKSTENNDEKQIFDIKLFQSGLWESQYCQYNKWHGPYQIDLFFDALQLKVIGSGVDDVGMYSLEGIYSTHTRRIGLTKTYQLGTGNPTQNLGHNVTIQLEWNRDNAQFEGKWYVRTKKFKGSGGFKLKSSRQQLPILPMLLVADEHWFVFDQYHFPAFSTPLFTLISSSINKTNVYEQKNLSFTLSSYERSIDINVNIDNRDKQLIKLNIERADLLYNTVNHVIFIALRQQTKLETYVNCKLIDSYLLYSTYFINENSSFEVQNLTEGIQYFQSTTNEYFHQEIFEKFSCKQIDTISATNNKTSTIGRPLIRKMQHVIEKIQRRKQRSRRNPNQQSSITGTTESLTIIYKPNIDQLNDNETNFRIILNVSQFAFQIRYYPKEHLFHIQFNNKNRTQFILYADKSTDFLNPTNYLSQGSLSSKNILSSIVLFLHITPTMITCYVNCELTDQEFIVDSSYVQNIIRQTMDKTMNNQPYEQKSFIEYNRQSTLILFNKSIDQIAANFFCLKLDKQNQDLLPDKYALRKFANALDILVDSLDTPMNINDQTLATTTQNIAAVNIHTINSFSSLIAPSLNTEINTISNEIIQYDKLCLIDQDCNLNNSLLKCQNKQCTCLPRYFWSSNLHRCISCKDVSIGNRCFRLSNHKTTWYDANDYCQNDNSFDEQQEYIMKLATNLNYTDIQLLQRSLLHEVDSEQLDYFYWIGLTSHSHPQKLHKRHVSTTLFRWYDNGETAQFNIPDLWCSQREHLNIKTSDKNQLCVSLTSCGLYADDCQRTYRFLCEAI